MTPARPACDSPVVSVSEQEVLSRLYEERFPPHLLERRREIWRRLYRDWFSQFVPARAAVLEIAPGYCEFINAVGADHERVGVDLNPDSARHAAPGVTIQAISACTGRIDPLTRQPVRYVEKIKFAQPRPPDDADG